jgi:hypothetical protein
MTDKERIDKLVDRMEFLERQMIYYGGLVEKLIKKEVQDE